MSSQALIAGGWERVSHPPSLFRRYEFGAYRETRAFLDRLAALSAETGCYPDLGFGTTYVNVTVRGTSGEPGPAELAFAERVAGLAT